MGFLDAFRRDLKVESGVSTKKNEKHPKLEEILRTQEAKLLIIPRQNTATKHIIMKNHFFIWLTLWFLFFKLLLRKCSCFFLVTTLSKAGHGYVSRSPGLQESLLSSPGTVDEMVRRRHTYHLTLLFANNKDEEPRQGIAEQQTHNQQKKIPVIGPFFNAPPLIVGATHFLNSPTPMQWKTIEFCVESMHQHQSDEQENAIATIQAAPLIAVRTQNSDMATLAAIVGISNAGNTDPDDDDSNLDTTDSTSLQESLTRISRQQRQQDGSSSSSLMYNDNVRVRFRGIGRAKLKDFASISFPISADDDNDVYEQDQILVADVQLVLDELKKKISNKNDRYDDDYPNKQASPVHSINELSMWTSRVEFLHTDRQKLVRGLQAAQTRLDCASTQWKDYDGIGTIFEDASGNDECNIGDNDASNEELREFIEMTMKDEDDNEEWWKLESSIQLAEETLRVSKLNNYGLGTTSSAHSSLQSLSKGVIKQLEPYYKPDRIESEEFYYCIMSWVALQSLSYFYYGSGTITKEVLAGSSSPTALNTHYSKIKSIIECCNTIDRMTQIYDDMLSHKQTLQELAKAKSRELRNCGEECTDLFL